MLSLRSRFCFFQFESMVMKDNLDQDFNVNRILSFHSQKAFQTSRLITTNNNKSVCLFKVSNETFLEFKAIPLELNSSRSTQSMISSYIFFRTNAKMFNTLSNYRLESCIIIRNYNHWVVNNWTWGNSPSV